MFREIGGTPTTGLDATGVSWAISVSPIFRWQNGHIPVDDEAVVLLGDGTVWVSDEYGPYVYHYRRRQAARRDPSAGRVHPDAQGCVRQGCE